MVIIRIRQAVKLEQGHAPFVVTSNFASSPSSSYYCRVPNRSVHRVCIFVWEQDPHIRCVLLSFRSLLVWGIARNRSPPWIFKHTSKCQHQIMWHGVSFPVLLLPLFIPFLRIVSGLLSKAQESESPLRWFVQHTIEFILWEVKEKDVIGIT